MYRAYAAEVANRAALHIWPHRAHRQNAPACNDSADMARSSVWHKGQIAAGMGACKGSSVIGAYLDLRNMDVSEVARAVHLDGPPAGRRSLGAPPPSR